MWRRAWSSYIRLLETRPVRTQIATSGLLWVAGDLTAQMIERQLLLRPAAEPLVQVAIQRAAGGAALPEEKVLLSTSPAEPLCWRRTAIHAGYASMVWAPMAHYWYMGIDRAALSMAIAGTWRFVGIKLALEVVGIHPLSIISFYSWTSIANGESVSDLTAQLNRDFLPVLGMAVGMWTPLDMANFALVPVRHQLLVTNVGCFFESICLSYLKANGFSIPGEH